MKKTVVLMILILFLAGCADSTTNVTTGSTTATSENSNESQSTVEQSQLDELLPELLCSECDVAEREAATRMFEIMAGLIEGGVAPSGEPVSLTPSQINITIDAYTSAVNTLSEGADTQTTEAAFDDAIDDLLDTSETNTTPGGTTT